MNEQQQQKGVVKYKISQYVKCHIRVKYTLLNEATVSHIQQCCRKIPEPETSLPT